MESALFIGDTHVGAAWKNGLSEVFQGKGHEFLGTLYDEIVTNVKKKQSLGYTVHPMLGGDMVDKPGKQNRDEAVAILSYLVSICNGEGYGVTGTPYHVGPNAEEDRDIYERLGIQKSNIAAVHRGLRLGNYTIAWSHHGVPIAGNPNGDARALFNFAEKVQSYWLSNGETIPDFVIGHHVHRSLGHLVEYVRSWHGQALVTRAGTVPCFSLPDEYAMRKLPHWKPTIGALWINLETGAYEYWTKETPVEVLYEWAR